MKKLLLPLFALVLIGAGCFGKNTAKPADQANNQNDAPAAQEPTTPTVQDSINGDAVAVYEGGTLQSLQSAQSNIYVTSPLPNATVGNSLVITGNARVFENTVSYRVKDVSGAVLSSGFATANSPDIGQYGAYQFNVNLSAVPAQPLIIEVYWASAKDGSDADLVSYVVQKQ